MSNVIKTLTSLAIIAMISACGSTIEADAVCKQPNTLHGTYEDIQGASMGILTLEGCEFKMVYGTGCILRGTYDVNSPNGGKMDLVINAVTPKCVGETPPTSSCTFSTSEPHISIDCAELDMNATLRRQGT